MIHIEKSFDALVAGCCLPTSPCAELCRARAVDMHNVFDISTTLHGETLNFTLSVEGYTNLKNFVHFSSPNDLSFDRER